MTSCIKKSEKFPEGIKHVIVIGVDGLSPDGIQKANTPVMDSMIVHGAVKWNVRTVLPSSSSQNWASMIMGAGSELHGVINNDWEIDDHMLPPIVQEEDGRFPTIFSVLKREKPDSEIGVVYNWKGFGRLFQKNAVDYDRCFSTEDSTAADFIHYIQDKKPTLGFIHFDHVDHAGHHEGHGSPAYYEAVAKTDSLIGTILTGIKDAGIESNTLVIITADHGGVGYGHGGPSPKEAEIAMIFSGENVKNGYSIEQQVYTYDLAATIAFALQVTPPYAWTGRPVKAAFKGLSEPENLWLGKEALPMPTIFPEAKLNQKAGGLYVDEQPQIVMAPIEGNLLIRYTLDGNEPDGSSSIYQKPFVVPQTTVVKAKTFNKEGDESLTSTAFFRVVNSGKGNGLKTTFYKNVGKNLTKLPSFESLKADSSWINPEINVDIEQITNMLDGENAPFALTFEGMIEIDNPGRYTFSIQSDDGGNLFINEKKVVDNDGNHGVIENAGSIELSAGMHPIRVEFFNNGGGFWIDAFYKGPDVTKQIIPPNKLFNL